MASRQGFGVLRSELKAREAKIAALEEKSRSQDALLRRLTEEHARVDSQFKELRLVSARGNFF